MDELQEAEICFFADQKVSHYYYHHKLTLFLWEM